MAKTHNGYPLAASLCLLLALTGCSEPEPPAPAPEAPPQPPAPAEVSEDLAEGVSARMAAVCEHTATLHAQVTGFLETPATDQLKAAREAWQRAHRHYRQLVTLYQIAGLDMPQVVDDRDPIDAHPILPGYLDQVPGYPRSGIVYSEVPLTPDFLRQEHQSTDFFYLTRGFHPLEFMLFGGSDDTLASQTEKFSGSVENEEEEINAPQRRLDLTRMISSGLTRDIRVLCTETEQQRLAEALAAVTDTLPEPEPAEHREDLEEPSQ